MEDDDDELFWAAAADKLQDQLDGITSAGSTLSQAHNFGGTDSPKFSNAAPPQPPWAQRAPPPQQAQQQAQQRQPAPPSRAPPAAGDQRGPSSQPARFPAAPSAPHTHWAAQPAGDGGSSRGGGRGGSGGGGGLPPGRVSLAAKQAAEMQLAAGTAAAHSNGRAPGGPTPGELEAALAQERGSNGLLRDRLAALERANYELRRELSQVKQEPARGAADPHTIADLNAQLKKQREQLAHVELELEDLRRAGGERDQRLQEELRAGRALLEENRKRANNDDAGKFGAAQLLQEKEALQAELEEMQRNRRDRAAGVLMSQQPSHQQPSQAGARATPRGSQADTSAEGRGAATPLSGAKRRRSGTATGTPGTSGATRPAPSPAASGGGRTPGAAPPPATPPPPAPATASWRLAVPPPVLAQRRQGAALRALLAECHDELYALMGAPAPLGTLPVKAATLQPPGDSGTALPGAASSSGGPEAMATLQAAGLMAAGGAAPPAPAGPPTHASILEQLQSSVRHAVSDMALGTARPVALCAAVGAYLIRLSDLERGATVTEVDGTEVPATASMLGPRRSLGEQLTAPSSAAATRGGTATAAMTPAGFVRTGARDRGSSVWQIFAEQPEPRWPALAAMALLRCLMRIDGESGRWARSRSGVSAEALAVAAKESDDARLRICFVDRGSGTPQDGNYIGSTSAAAAAGAADVPGRAVRQGDGSLRLPEPFVISTTSAINTEADEAAIGGDTGLLSALLSLRDFLRGTPGDDAGELSRLATLSLIVTGSPRGALPSGMAVALLAPGALEPMLLPAASPAERVAALELAAVAGPRALELPSLWGLAEESEGAGAGISSPTDPSSLAGGGVLEALLDCLHAPSAEEAASEIVSEIEAELRAGDTRDAGSETNDDSIPDGPEGISLGADYLSRLRAEGGGHRIPGAFWGRLGVPRAGLALLAALLAGRQVSVLAALLSRGLASQLALLLDGATRDAGLDLLAGLDHPGRLLGSTPQTALSHRAGEAGVSTAPGPDDPSSAGRRALLSAQAGVGAEYLRLTQEALTMLRALLMEPSLAGTLVEDLTTSIATLRLSFGALSRLTAESTGGGAVTGPPGLPLAPWAAGLSRPYANAAASRSQGAASQGAVGAAAAPSVLRAGQRAASLAEVACLVASVKRRLTERRR
eukprot:jgi/Tetstr1/428372/TSEL_018407.t1